MHNTQNVRSVILASASPRRQEILNKLDIPFLVVPAAGEPQPEAAWAPDKAALYLARYKAEEVAHQYPDHVVIGADTIVCVDGEMLGKPRDEEDAFRMLSLLQGRCHQVITGVWVCSPERKDGFSSVAEVEFYPMDDAEIQAYIRTGEPMDKAGGYGIQGKGMRYIKGIQGDFYTVMGLPGAALWRFLEKFRT